MAVENNRSYTKVDRWVSVNVKEFDRTLGHKQLVSLGKHTASKRRRVLMKALHVLSLTLYSPKKYYAKKGREHLQVRNYRVLTEALTENQRKGKTLGCEKTAKLTAKVSAVINGFKAEGKIPGNLAMTFPYYKENLEAACLRYTFEQKEALWMTDVGFGPAERETAPLSLLQTVDLVRKAGKGESFADWLVDNPAVGEETLEQSIDRFADVLLQEMGTAFEVHYQTKQQMVDRHAFLKEVFSIADLGAEVVGSFSSLGVNAAYMAYASNKLQSGETPAQIFAVANRVRAELAGAVERYRRSGGESKPAIEEQFKEYIKRRHDLFADGAVGRIQNEFNQEQAARLKMSSPALKLAVAAAAVEGKHYTETPAGQADALIQVVLATPFGKCVQAISEVSPENVIDHLSPLCDLIDLYALFGMEKFFKKEAEAFLGDKANKALRGREKIERFIETQQGNASRLARLEGIQEEHFAQKGADAVFFNAVATAIKSEAAKNKQALLGDVLEVVCVQLERDLEGADGETILEKLCDLFVKELNALAGSNKNNALFDPLFVKRFLLDGDLEEQMKHLTVWARFARGKKHEQMKSFITDFDELLMSRYLEAGKEQKKDVAKALEELYSAYHEKNSERHVSALVDALKEASSVDGALDGTEGKTVAETITCMANLIIYADVVKASSAYEHHLIIAGIVQQIEERGTFTGTVGAFGSQEGKRLLYQTVFKLFLEEHADIGYGKQHGEEFIVRLARLFDSTESLVGKPKLFETKKGLQAKRESQLTYAKQIAEMAGRCYRGGIRRHDILTELSSAKGRKTITFDFEKIGEKQRKDFKDVVLPSIEERLERLKPQRRAEGTSRNCSTFSAIAHENPEKLVTALLPAFIEPLLRDEKDLGKVRGLKKRLREREPEIAQIGAVKTLGEFFVNNRDAVTVIAALPPEESNRLAGQVLDALVEHAASKKDRVKPPHADTIPGMVGTHILDAAVDILVNTFSEARNTNVNKLPFPSKQEFHDNFPDVSAIREHWAYKHVLPHAPKLLNIVGRSGAVGEKLMKVPLTLLLKVYTKEMSKEDQSAFIKSMGPVIEVLSLAISSFLQRHDYEAYFDFLQEGCDYLHQPKTVTEGEQAAFEVKVWSFLHQVLSDLSDYPQAVEEVLLAISDLANGSLSVEFQTTTEK